MLGGDINMRRIDRDKVRGYLGGKWRFTTNGIHG